VEVAADISAGAEGISAGAADISAEVEGISEALEGDISAGADISAAATLVGATLAVGTSAVAISAVVGLGADSLAVAALPMAVATSVVVGLGADSSAVAASPMGAASLVVVGLGADSSEVAALPMGAASLVVVGLGADSSEVAALPMGADSSEAAASPMGAASLVAEAASIEMRSAFKAGGIALPEPEASVELAVMTGAVVGAVGADGRGQCFGPISSATSSRSRSGRIITIRSGRMVPGLTLTIANTRPTTGMQDGTTYTVTYMAQTPMVTDTEDINAIATLVAAQSRPIQMKSELT